MPAYWTILGRNYAELTFLMDPVTWSWLTCGWLIETSAGGILGNRVDAAAVNVWTQGWKAFTQKMRGDCPTPINRDLEIAVYRAFLLAQWSLISDCLEEFTGGTWTGLSGGRFPLKAGYAVLPEYAEQDVSWLQAQLKQIQADLKRLQAENYSAIPAGAFDVSMELVIADRGLVAADAETMLRDELATSVLTDGIPESYRLRAQAVGTGLFERVAAFFAFELKTNAKVQGLFQNQLLMQINQQLEGLSVPKVALKGIEAQLKTVATQLPEVLVKIDNLEIAVAGLGKGIDEVTWLVASRTDDLIRLAISNADDLSELKRQVADVLRELQQRSQEPTAISSSDSEKKPIRKGPNPFIYGPAVPPEYFYGRKRQLAHIRQQIGGRVPQCVNVVGFRRSGKSSVLRYVKERTSEFCVIEQKPIVVLLDLQDKRFHQPIGIIEGLRRGIEKQTGKPPWERASNDDLFDVEDGLEDLRSQGYRLIVMFDEFEAIGERLEVFHDWGDHWRAQASACRLSLVIASKRPVSDIYNVLELTSPFGNIFSTVVLGALEAESWQQLMTDGELLEEEIHLVHKLGGKLPYYTQLAANIAWQHSNDYTLAHKDFLQQAHGRFVALWKGLSPLEQQTLRHIVNAKPSQSSAATLEQLQMHGLLQSGQTIFSEPFSDFVRQQS